MFIYLLNIKAFRFLKTCFHASVYQVLSQYYVISGVTTQETSVLLQKVTVECKLIVKFTESHLNFTNFFKKFIFQLCFESKNIMSSFRIRWLCGSCFNIYNQITKKFFDVKSKVSEGKTVTVRILKEANQTITKEYLKSLRQEWEPVKLKSLSKTQNGMFF